jgi:hypothetical protein
MDLLSAPDKLQRREKGFALMSDLTLRGNGAGFNKNIQQKYLLAMNKLQIGQERRM